MEGSLLVMEHMALIVEDMSCSHCENTVKKVVSALNGVENVIVDLNAKKVIIEFDAEKVSTDIIKGTIEDQGYTVR